MKPNSKTVSLAKWSFTVVARWSTQHRLEVFLVFLSPQTPRNMNDHLRHYTTMVVRIYHGKYSSAEDEREKMENTASSSPLLSYNALERERFTLF